MRDKRETETVKRQAGDGDGQETSRRRKQSRDRQETETVKRQVGEGIQVVD